MHKAAEQDAEEQVEKKDFLAASRSYSFAIMAAKKTHMLEMRPLLELMWKYGECLLKTSSWVDVFSNAVEIAECQEDYSRVIFPLLFLFCHLDIVFSLCVYECFC
jgi:hypothetical protein